MNRRIITSQLMSGGEAEVTVDTYINKLWKYIPADVVAFYIFVSGLISGVGGASQQQLYYWIALGLGLVATFAWTIRQTQLSKQNPAYVQAAISTLAFGGWVFALGGPFTSFSWYTSVLGAIILAAFTLFIPLINPE